MSFPFFAPITAPVKQANFTSSQSTDFWIGLTRANKNADWQWIDGSPYGIFTHWYYQPGNGAKEKRSNCACLFPSRWSTYNIDFGNLDSLTQGLGFVCRKYKALSILQAAQGYLTGFWNAFTRFARA